jgi:2-polyprenyl-3-methyl-5-hydroxy-6-metoxy-1,4-benzoquinol methylase
MGMARVDSDGIQRAELYLMGMEQKGILHRALSLRAAGDPREDAELEDLFHGSIDRFCEITFRLQSCPKNLDVGAGQGMLAALLSRFGHECHALDIFDQTVRHAGIYRQNGIHFQVCNRKVDPLHFADNTFDAVVCCQVQVLEHFTHSVMKEISNMLLRAVSAFNKALCGGGFCPLAAAGSR